MHFVPILVSRISEQDLHYYHCTLCIVHYLHYTIFIDTTIVIIIIIANVVIIILISIVIIIITIVIIWQFSSL